MSCKLILNTHPENADDTTTRRDTRLRVWFKAMVRDKRCKRRKRANDTYLVAKERGKCE